LGLKRKKGEKSLLKIELQIRLVRRVLHLIFPNLFIPLNYFQLKSIYPAGWAPRRVIYGASGAKKMVAGNRKWK